MCLKFSHTRLKKTAFLGKVKMLENRVVCVIFTLSKEYYRGWSFKLGCVSIGMNLTNISVAML